jgi:hypothetical protein
MVSLCLRAVGVAALALAALAAQAQTPSPALQAKSPDAAVIARMAAHGPVRILVYCRLAVAPPRNGARDAETGRINRATQDAILADHFGPPDALTGPDRALRRLEVTPAFAINASAAEIESLAQDGRVLQIVQDQPRRLVPRNG